MKKGYGMSIHLGYITLISILIVVIYVLKISYHKPGSVQIEPELLYSVLQEGSYTGTSKINGTELYKNGLLCKHNVKITRTDDGVHAINNVIAYDANTNKLEYNAVRKIQFSYKPNHDNNLFKVSNSYIDDRLVSSSYGYATGKTSNSISFNLSGSWHISNKEYHNIYNTISRPSNDTMDNVFKHYNMFGLNDLTLDEKYTMNSQY